MFDYVVLSHTLIESIIKSAAHTSSYLSEKLNNSENGNMFVSRAFT